MAATLKSPPVPSGAIKTPLERPTSALQSSAPEAKVPVPPSTVKVPPTVVVLALAVYAPVVRVKLFDAVTSVSAVYTPLTV